MNSLIRRPKLSLLKMVTLFRPFRVGSLHRCTPQAATAVKYLISSELTTKRPTVYLRIIVYLSRIFAPKQIIINMQLEFTPNLHKMTSYNEFIVEIIWNIVEKIADSGRGPCLLVEEASHCRDGNILLIRYRLSLQRRQGVSGRPVNASLTGCRISPDN